jgi:hypothetical protein
MKRLLSYPGPKLIGSSRLEVVHETFSISTAGNERKYGAALLRHTAKYKSARAAVLPKAAQL